MSKLLASCTIGQLLHGFKIDSFEYHDPTPTKKRAKEANKDIICLVPKPFFIRNELRERHLDVWIEYLPNDIEQLFSDINIDAQVTVDIDEFNIYVELNSYDKANVIFELHNNPVLKAINDLDENELTLCIYRVDKETLKVIHD